MRAESKRVDDFNQIFLHLFNVEKYHTGNRKQDFEFRSSRNDGLAGDLIWPVNPG